MVFASFAQRGCRVYFPCLLLVPGVNAFSSSKARGAALGGLANGRNVETADVMCMSWRERQMGCLACLVGDGGRRWIDGQGRRGGLSGVGWLWRRCWVFGGFLRLHFCRHYSWPWSGIDTIEVVSRILHHVEESLRSSRRCKQRPTGDRPETRRTRGRGRATLRYASCRASDLICKGARRYEYWGRKWDNDVEHRGFQAIPRGYDDKSKSERRHLIGWPC
ncbi:hypothetical protein HDK64DRAFT_54295 [Phyllosticta capitalensis]